MLNKCNIRWFWVDVTTKAQTKKDHKKSSAFDRQGDKTGGWKGSWSVRAPKLECRKSKNDSAKILQSNVKNESAKNTKTLHLK